MQIIRPPHPHTGQHSTIFLAGSIEMDTAANWQQTFADALAHTDLCLLNPRRLHWDANLSQSIHTPAFVEQVEWELSALETADLIVMYFDPATKSPISLLELGLFARSGKLIVCCPDGFWRKGNVDIVCARYGVPQVPDLQALITAALVRMNP